VVANLSLIHLDEEIVARAEALSPAELRTLDAIHIASAQSLGDQLGALITYDWRMIAAARAVGIAPLSPR
jgi:hypothetical protein